MTQLARLAKPFPDRDVERKPGGSGGDYVKHSTVTEKLLATVGPFSTRVDHIIYDGDILSGVVLTLTVTVDGRTVSVTEAGDNENPTAKTNGARLKDCMSDAIKRCAMRVGVGLHLWSQDSYRLHEALIKSAPVPQGATGPVLPPGAGPESVPRSGDADDGEARQEPLPGAMGAGVVESSSANNLGNTAENDTESNSDSSADAGVVREMELAPPTGDSRGPDGSGPSGPSSARRRLDRARGHA